MHPFTDAPDARVSRLGERGLISAIRSWLGDACPPHPHGIGDDCAVVPWSKAGHDLLITTDPVIFGRHFDASVPAAAAGAKLFRRNLSDIAAMGGEPVSAVVSVSLPENTSVRWLRGFYRGLAEVSREWNVPLVGGDLTGCEGSLAAHLTLVGRSARGRALTRTGARPGDGIFVTGSLGGSILGKHHRFTPRLREAAWLASTGAVRACMDISDGLAKDLPAMVPPGCVARVDSDRVPVSAAARKVSRSSGQPALRHALCDGEDYELLLCIDPEPARLARLLRAFNRRFDCGLTCIGTVVRAPAKGRSDCPVVSATGDIQWSSLAGYEHFR